MDYVEISGSTGLGAEMGQRQRLTIGRDTSNDLVVRRDSTASRRHALLTREGEHWRIEDLGSRNGTYVNGNRVRGRATVRPGDVIRVGKTELRIGAASPNAGLPTNLPDPGPGPVLTAREAQVLRMVAEGLTDQQIAASLVVSPRTVHSHLERIRAKVGLRRRSELTRYAISNGYLPNRP